MDADLDTFVTALYVTIDDALRLRPELRQWRPRVGLAPRLSDAELCTLAVLQALLGFTAETRFLRRPGAPCGPGSPTSRTSRATTSACARQRASWGR